VDAVLDALAAEFGEPRALVLAGFSQGVAMAYRAAQLGRRTCAALAVAGGDLPPEFAAGAPRAWPRVLIATGTGDEYYDPAHAERDAALVRGQGGEVRTLCFAGGHEWGDAVADGVAALLAEVGRA